MKTLQKLKENIVAAEIVLEVYRVDHLGTQPYMKDVEIGGFVEDAPTNSAGGGNIAGIGVGATGEPGVSPAHQRNKKQLKLMNGPAVDPRMFRDAIFKRNPMMETETLDGMTYHDHHQGSHHDQHDYTLWAQHHSRIPDSTSKQAGIPHAVGAASYSEYKGKVHLNMIQTHPKHTHQGVASGLIDTLHRKYGYKNIKWGMSTPEGTALKKKMDAKYKTRTPKFKS